MIFSFFCLIKGMKMKQKEKDFLRNLEPGSFVRFYDKEEKFFGNIFDKNEDGTFKITDQVGDVYDSIPLSNIYMP